MNMTWTPNSWRARPANHIPDDYPDVDALANVEARLKDFPPLVFAGEVRRLKQQLATVSRGEAFLLQGGDWDDRSELVINGTLIAEAATSTNPIVFTSSAQTPAARDWGTIRFNAGAGGSLKYCEINAASYGIYTYGNNANPTIDNCTISGNSQYGVYAHNYSAPTISNSTITNNQYGIETQNNAVPIVTDSTISNNSSYGIYGGNGGITSAPSTISIDAVT